MCHCLTRYNFPAQVLMWCTCQDIKDSRTPFAGSLMHFYRRDWCIRLTISVWAVICGVYRSAWCMLRNCTPQVQTRALESMTKSDANWVAGTTRVLGCVVLRSHRRKMHFIDQRHSWCSFYRSRTIQLLQLRAMYLLKVLVVCSLYSSTLYNI